MLRAMSIWRSVSLLAALGAAAGAAIGCGGSSKKAADEPATSGADAAAAEPKAPQPVRTCEEAQANVLLFTQHVSQSLALTVGKRCAEDGWAQEVVNCFAATQDGPDLGLCTALLTPEQQRSLELQDVPDAVDPDAPLDPACAVFTAMAAPPAGQGAAVAAAPAAPAAENASAPQPRPNLGLPGSGGAASAPAAAPVAPAAKAAPATKGAPATAAPAAPAVARRTITPKQLEQLRQAGETQLAPDAAEQRLMARCRVDRAVASFKLCIDEAGAPALVETIRSSRLAGYDRKLLTAIGGWRYRPYLLEGKATEVCSAVTFVYSVK